MRKTQNSTSGFESASRKHAELKACDKHALEAQTARDQLFQQAKGVRDEHMFRWLIERATENFRKQLSLDNPCLLQHFIGLFKKRGYLFTDSSGVSGFLLPPSKMRTVKGTVRDQELIAGLKVKVQRIVNFGHRSSVSVQALTIYRGSKDQSDQDSRPPTIALVVRCNEMMSSDITQKHLANCRVALLGGSDLDTPPLKPDFHFPGNQDYMLKLVELCTPETMFEQVFKHHGPVELD